MCSIFGALGVAIDEQVLDGIRDRARDRGRDGGRVERYRLADGWAAALGNWRATPTTEVEAAQSQPYARIVHNGTIANDRELGNSEGNVDSMVLEHVLDRSSLEALRDSLTAIQGSYALAVAADNTIYLATNYKPIYVLQLEHARYFSSMERHLLPLCEFGVRPQRIEPYTVTDLRTGRTLKVSRETNQRALVIASAGLDSTTAAYLLKDEGYQVDLLHFGYGAQAGTREHTLIREIARDLGAQLVNLTIDYSKFAGSSPLLNDSDIAAGESGAEFAHEWVPALNLLMISHAVAYAEANGYTYIALGHNLEESGAYPDNEEEFTKLLNDSLDYAVHDGGHVVLMAPVGNLMKHEIVKLGLELGVPYQYTWSCYRGGDKHCGNCGPCFMRMTAFERNGTTDPAPYEE